jgi:histidinol-phosphatase (PHP family)
MIESTLFTAQSADLHTHSTHSLDGNDSIDAMCRAAVERGLRAIAFTEHLYVEPFDASYGFFDYGRYLADIEVARHAYGNRIHVLSGIEIGYQPQYHDEILSFLADKDFDLVLGSVHYVGTEFVFSTLLDGRTEEEAYGAYFDVVLRAAQSGLFDALAHLDVVKRFGVQRYGAFEYERYAGHIDAILVAMIASHTALEVNTSGLRQAPKETYPAADVVARYLELGGEPVVIGSDAHCAAHVGLGVRHAALLPARARIPVRESMLLSSLA